jgi:hypothetical protein
MNDLNRVEFYTLGGGMILSCRSAAVPRQDEHVNIAKQQWRVAMVSWAIDTDDGRPALRANVELIPATPPAVDTAPAEEG